MTRHAKFGLVLSAMAIAAAWLVVARGTMHAILECMRPTSVVLLSLPDACVPTNEVPPARLTQIIEQQRDSYHLALQKVTVCRTNESARILAPDGQVILSADQAKKWLPLYVGCCSYQFGRHVVVLIGDIQGKQAIIVQAALVQTRMAYLRQHW